MMKHGITTFLIAAMVASMSLTSADVAEDGSKRGKPPKGWPRMEWPILKEVLFGHYAPTDEERVLMEKAYPKKATAKPAKARKLLIFYRCQYPHTSIATGTEAFRRMGEITSAYEPVLTDDPAMFTPEKLAEFDAVLLNNTTSWDKTLGKERTANLIQFVKNGGGLIGIHAASDACGGHPEAAAMIGGIFRCHPWLPKGTWAFQLESPQHPINEVFGNKGFWMRDEIYIYRDGSHKRSRSRVLVSLDMEHDENCNGKHLHKKQKHLATKDEHPVVWVHELGKGRVFYSNFGHNNMTYWKPRILKQYLDGIQYALGDIKADATVSTEVPKEPRAKAPAKGK